MALIVQSGPFWAQKRCFLARNHFFVDSLKKNVTIMTGHLKDNLFVLTALQGCLQGAVRAHFWAKKWPQNLIFFTLHLYNPVSYTHLTLPTKA